MNIIQPVYNVVIREQVFKGNIYYLTKDKCK